VSDEKKSFMATPPKNGVIVSVEGGRALNGTVIVPNLDDRRDNATCHCTTTTVVKYLLYQRAKTRVRETYRIINYYVERR